MAFEVNEHMVELVRDLHGAGLADRPAHEQRPRAAATGGGDCSPYDELFDDVVDSHEVGMRKPNPAIYRLALERLGATADRTAFLDDIASNVAAAQAEGMVGVLVEGDGADAIAHVRRAGRAELSSWRRRRGDGSGRRGRRPGWSAASAARSVAPVVTTSSTTSTRASDPAAGDERRARPGARGASRPVWGGPSSTRRSRPRHGTPSRQATARASTSAWS